MREPFPDAADVFGIWASADDDVWVAGTVDAVFHREAPGWTRVPRLRAGTAMAAGRYQRASGRGVKRYP
jgi:hypothetical protein